MLNCRSAFCVCLLAILNWASLSLAGQGQKSSYTSQGTILIDGSKTPELISDRHALRVWLLSVAEPPDSGPEQTHRMQVKVLGTGLNINDARILLMIVTQFANQRKSIMEQEITDKAMSKQQIRAAREQLFMDTEASIHKELSPQGIHELSKHLLHVKQHMVIGAGPVMHYQNNISK